MRLKLAGELKVDISQVSVKAGTANLLGFVGREEGIAAMAVCTITSE
jgi:2-C-methyl-D-erythritol 2,4-cyclodiphosphate synthase